MGVGYCDKCDRYIDYDTTDECPLLDETWVCETFPDADAPVCVDSPDSANGHPIRRANGATECTRTPQT